MHVTIVLQKYYIVKIHLLKVLLISETKKIKKLKKYTYISVIASIKVLFILLFYNLVLILEKDFYIFIAKILQRQGLARKIN